MFPIAGLAVLKKGFRGDLAFVLPYFERRNWTLSLPRTRTKHLASSLASVGIIYKVASVFSGCFLVYLLSEGNPHVKPVSSLR
jgi:hypothetical protein